ncbi:hypothetical protein Tco_1438113 [Tanacetum coccineum]
MHTTIVPEQVKTMKIQAGIQVSRPVNLKDNFSFGSALEDFIQLYLYLLGTLFTKLIVYYLQSKHKFHPRPGSPLHFPNEEPILGYLKFSAKGTKQEVFGMPIPNDLITDDIRGEQYYNAYLEKVAKHQRYLAGEEVSDPDSPAPKPAKATKPKASKQSKPLAPKNKNFSSICAYTTMMLLRGTKREVFGMPISNDLITDDIQGEQYYNAYLEKVAKHQRYLAGEEVSDPDSPAPKSAKATKPKASKQSKPLAPKDKNFSSICAYTIMMLLRVRNHHG